MSSLIRRMEIRQMKKAGYSRDRVKVVNSPTGPKLVDVRRGGLITDPNGDPVGYRWPARLPACAVPEKRQSKPVRIKAARGSRRGKHSAKWIAARNAKRGARP